MSPGYGLLMLQMMTDAWWHCFSREGRVQGSPRVMQMAEYAAMADGTPVSHWSRVSSADSALCATSVPNLKISEWQRKIDFTLQMAVICFRCFCPFWCSCYLVSMSSVETKEEIVKESVCVAGWHGTGEREKEKTFSTAQAESACYLLLLLGFA